MLGYHSRLQEIVEQPPNVGRQYVIRNTPLKQPFSVPGMNLSWFDAENIWNLDTGSSARRNESF